MSKVGQDTVCYTWGCLRLQVVDLVPGVIPGKVPGVIPVVPEVPEVIHGVVKGRPKKAA